MGDLMKQAQEKYPAFDVPDPLIECSAPGCEHAALGSGEGGYWCGACAAKKSLFWTYLSPDDIRQRAADEALTEADPERTRKAVQAEIEKLDRELA